VGGLPKETLSYRPGARGDIGGPRERRMPRSQQFERFSPWTEMKTARKLVAWRYHLKTLAFSLHAPTPLDTHHPAFNFTPNELLKG
jgi:hypothetical protein